MKPIQIKVCGMRDSHNIEQLSQLPIDFMGMIFYPKSPRYVSDLLIDELSKSSLSTLKRVGVFVNESLENVEQKIEQYRLDYVQLHGHETYDYCLQLNRKVPIIKAFSVESAADMDKVNNYGSFDGYVLFDTKTPHYGGSGTKFDWSILNHYKGDIPFLLSGGISEEDIESIRAIQHPQFVGIDLNSKFEIEPGLKDIDRLQKFINDIRL